MSLLKQLLLGQSIGAGKPKPIFPTEYVFTEGIVSPYNIKYDDTEGSGPYTIATSEESYAVAQAFQRKLVRLSDGTLIAIYHKQLAGKYQIYVKQSADDGATWTNEIRISTYTDMASYDQKYASIAVDSSDHLHVVWRGMATGFTAKDQIWYAKYTDSWQTPIRISTYTNMNNYNQWNASIAVDSSDYLHVVWDGMASGFTTYGQIWYALYNGAWQAPVRISTYAGMDGQHQSYPSLAIDSSNKPHTIWYGMATGYSAGQVWYAKYTNSWQTPVRISTYAGMESYTQISSSIAIDSAGYIHVVFQGKATGFITNDQIWYAKYTNSWQSPIRISTYTDMNAQEQYRPTIAVDSNNYLHVVWYGKASGYTDYDKVWYAKYETSWATPTILQATGQNMYPNLRWSRWP